MPDTSDVLSARAGEPTPLASHAPDQSLRAHHAQFAGLLMQARLPVQDVAYGARAAARGAGREATVTVTCPAGHRITLTLGELHDAIDNRTFNDAAVVPYLCNACCYPGAADAAPRKTTVYHRLAILRHWYPEASYVGGFDMTGKEMEQYQCGRALDDGTPHPPFAIRPDKLTASHRDSTLRHTCYVCGLEAGQVPETKNKTLAMLEARMRLIAQRIDRRTQRTPHAPTVRRTEGDDGSSPLSTYKTALVFSCGQPGHASMTATADNYFKIAKGGYCRACLKDAKVRHTAELSPQPDDPHP